MTSHKTGRSSRRRNCSNLTCSMASSTSRMMIFATTLAMIFAAAGAAGGGELWPAERPPGMPSIRSLDVMCGKEHMDVQIAFSHPFSGIVFSKGQYGDPRCVYVAPLGRGGGAGAVRPGLSLHPGAAFRTGRKAKDEESLRPGVVVTEDRHRLRGSRSGWTPGENDDKEVLVGTETANEDSAEDRFGLGEEEGRAVGGLGDDGRGSDGGRVFRFRIAYSRCGTRPDHRGQFYENTVVVQYDRDLLEVWDEAKRLRCEWFDDYEKKTASKPPMVIADLDVVQLDFRGDNVECWMEVQQGKGPWAPPVSGIVPLGTTLTLVIAINDFTGEFDMRVKSCSASDGGEDGAGGHAIQLSDDRGCVLRPKMVGRFLKTTGTDGRATLLTYAFFSAFKFPGALGVHIRCKVEICRHGCPDHCGDDTIPARHPALDRSAVRSRRGEGPTRITAGPTRRRGEHGTQGGPRSLDHGSSSTGTLSNRRRRRGVANSEEEVVGVSGGYSVISEADMAEEETESGTEFEAEDNGSRWWGRSRLHEVCVPAHGFGAAFLLAASAAAASAVLAGALFHRYRGTRAAQAKGGEAGVVGDTGMEGGAVEHGGLWGWVAMRWPARGG